MAERGTERPRGFGPQQVLVVEDDQSISNLLKIILEQNGFVVTVAPDYARARVAVEASGYELMLLDIGLPDGNGLELVRWIRDDLALTTPIIVLSAYRQEENVEKAFGFGANDFVAKPFRPKELMLRVHRVVER
jgi:DNA-binding response OmpR family regulator